jgi:hypothetical protein
MKNIPTIFSGMAADLRPVRSLITVSDDSEVIIESCKRIIECNDIKCTVLTHGYIIDVWGAELTLTSFANGNVGVYGKIQSISISRKPRALSERTENQ